MKLEEKRAFKREELAELFKELSEGVKERGIITIAQNEIPLPNHFDVELEYKEKHGRKKIEIEVEWSGEVSIPPQTVAGVKENPQGIVISKQKIASVSQVQGGSSIAFNYRGMPAVLVHLPDGEFRAYVAICTHKGERIERRGDKLLCPKHNAIFDSATGAALRAPAHEPLRKIEVEVIGDEIFAV